MSTQGLNAGQLLAQWLSEYSTDLPPERSLFRIRLAEPRFQTRNYFHRFKVETATFDGTGQNPTNISCVVVEVSEADQTANIAQETACDAIKDA